MKIKLPRAVLEGLPEPDQKGYVQVSATLRVGADGEAKLCKINDTPVGEDDDEPMGRDPAAIEAGIYA